jgi:uncharacterized protein (TIGR02466 family)
MPGLEGAEFTALFATPFLSYRWPDSDALNKELRQRILAHERENPGRDNVLNGVGHWRTAGGLLEFCGDAGKTVIDRMSQFVNEATARALAGRSVPPFEWQIQAWPNVNRAGDYHRMHNHGMCTWSGTYYVDDGDPPPEDEFGTALEIVDPCGQRAITFFPGALSPGLYIKPLPGLMVLFPSYVMHMVMPHRGKKPRISIAFNYRKHPFP